MSILKGLLTAREGSYFKSEQEDDLSAYRRRRIREGALKETDVPLLDGERSLFPVSDTKLAEIHAQEARVSAPMRGERLRVSSQMPPISTEGGHSKDKSIAGTYRVPSARGAVWGGLDAVRASHEQNKLRALLPEESAAMRKTKAVADKALVAGTRALAYGSLLAAAGVFGGGMLAATALNIRDANDLRLALLNHLGPSVASAKLKLVPYKEWLESHGLSTNSETLEGQSTVRWIEDSVIVRDLRRKFRMRRSGE
tara:strand:+ start:12744 stop:13508 length:765 start_codon:yes stop_codon:yes gene_type:complete